MCNLYSLTKGQQAIRDLAGAMRDMSGKSAALPRDIPRLCRADRAQRP